MAKQNKKEDRRRKGRDDDSSFGYLKEETVRAIVAVGFFVLAIFLTLASEPVGKGGPVGENVYNFLHYLFGFGYYILPILFLILGVSFFRSIHKRLALTHSIGGLLFFLSSLALISIFSLDSGGYLEGTSPHLF